MTKPSQFEEAWNMSTVNMLCADLRKAIEDRDWKKVVLVEATGRAMVEGFRQATAKQQGRAGRPS